MNIDNLKLLDLRTILNSWLAFGWFLLKNNKLVFKKLNFYICSHKEEVKLELSGQEIEWVKKRKYLGVWIDGKLYSREHLRERRLSTLKAIYLLKNNLDKYNI
ncbi:hypothetical protein BpHYR1_026610 [Brachionus plicatilis]|uniref:Uncharacterized protein n=1 Tax=Brachionus plicatilis TaxID=10195 RepID=A0A3M7P6P1_BRAPC|nr:hypothetical protein BpHYR1_026610 [Brachionus plicatilis]